MSNVLYDNAVEILKRATELQISVRWTDGKCRSYIRGGVVVSTDFTDVLEALDAAISAHEEATARAEEVKASLLLSGLVRGELYVRPRKTVEGLQWDVLRVEAEPASAPVDTRAKSKRQEIREANPPPSSSSSALLSGQPIAQFTGLVAALKFINESPDSRLPESDLEI